jgi:hypothetical protein
MRGLGSCSLSAVHAHHVVQSDGLGFVPIGTARRQQRAFAGVRPQPLPASEKGRENACLPGQETATTMLSVAAHMGQAKVRKSKPGLSCSRSERIIGASQSGQNRRSSVALPRKNEGTERLSTDASVNWAGARHSQSPIDAVGGAVMQSSSAGFRNRWSVLLTFKNFDGVIQH